MADTISPRTMDDYKNNIVRIDRPFNARIAAPAAAAAATIPSPQPPCLTTDWLAEFPYMLYSTPERDHHPEQMFVRARNDCAFVVLAHPVHVFACRGHRVNGYRLCGVLNTHLCVRVAWISRRCAQCSLGQYNLSIFNMSIVSMNQGLCVCVCVISAK